MATDVLDPYTQMADAVEAAVVAEFDDLEYIDVRHDRLHDSLGGDGVYYVGLSPDSDRRNGLRRTTDMTIQFFAPYTPDVDPFQQSDPRIITNMAERMAKALGGGRNLGTREVWYFTVNDTRYPNDPVGNKTRFQMSVSGEGDNVALLETIG